MGHGAPVKPLSTTGSPLDCFTGQAWGIGKIFLALAAVGCPLAALPRTVKIGVCNTEFIA